MMDFGEWRGESRAERLNRLRSLMEEVEAGGVVLPETQGDVNNHIHTFYSFSPYSPAEAVWRACQAGLATAGIMDHDSISGAVEFIEAGRITGLPVTVGVECRADFSNTELAGRRINNPDQDSIAYIALHGIPHTRYEAVDAFFRPYRAFRNERNRAMTVRLNEILRPWDLQIDFERDVVPLSMHAEGGSITERHILCALALRLIDTFGKGERLTRFLKRDMKLAVSPKADEYLSDENNIHYSYDLLGVLKSELLSEFYIDAREECPDIRDLIDFGKKMGAIVTYAYLGDVENSVTGDKRAQRFEDGYLDSLFRVLKTLGFDAVTYMPSRNSNSQLDRIKALCEQNQFFQISGEDINSSRQPFICKAMRSQGFRHLADAAWALIGHEKAAALDPGMGMFSPETVAKYPGLRERIERFKALGRRTE